MESILKESEYYYRLKFNNKNRSVIITQIRTINSKRLLRKVDIIANVDFNNIVGDLIDILKSETPTISGGISEPKGDNGLILSQTKIDAR